MAKNNLLFLNFHSIFRPSTKYQFHYDPIFSISEEKLIHCFELLKRNNINCGSWKDLGEGKFPLKNTIFLSFDDGHVSDFEIALPLLKEYELDACFFIVAENLVQNIEDKERIRKISNQGFTIGSHSISHRKMTRLTEKEQLFELKESKTIIENCLQKKVNFFAFPNGRHSTHLIKLGKQTGYSMLFTTQAKWSDPNLNSFTFGRWSIKQNTSFIELEKIIMNHKYSSFKLKYHSKLKYFLLKLVDKINP